MESEHHVRMRVQGQDLQAGDECRLRRAGGEWLSALEPANVQRPGPLSPRGLLMEGQILEPRHCLPPAAKRAGCKPSTLPAGQHASGGAHLHSERHIVEALSGVSTATPELMIIRLGQLRCMRSLRLLSMTG
jgi:hypothetical protein